MNEAKGVADQSVQHAHALIGRVVVEWAQFEQLVVSKIWRARDPQGAYSFAPPITEVGFSALWSLWADLHKAAASDPAKLQAFEREMKAFSQVRNDLCHNIFEVAATQNFEFSVGVHRRILNWRVKFDKWSKKYAQADPRTRPAPPQNEILRYDRRDIDAILAALKQATKRVQDYSDALVKSSKV